MREWEQEVLGQYDIDIKNRRKIRGGLLCEADDNIYLLTETKFSETRLEMLECLEKHLVQDGIKEIDLIVRNREGKLLCELEDGTKYFLKHWFSGRECDIKKENEILNATKNLTRLHRSMRKEIEWKDGGKPYSGEALKNVFVRRNRELKKVRSYIRNKVDKGTFENAFLSNYGAMYEWAENSICKLEELNENNLRKALIHGDYNYHNILILHNGVATTNFEHFQENIQVTDLYYFFRKAMEKYNWNVRLGEQMLDYYQRFLSLTDDERLYIGICIAYPEKFWKAANSYARAKKTWISAKSVEKLEMISGQMEQKRSFLDKVFDFRL